MLKESREYQSVFQISPNVRVVAEYQQWVASTDDFANGLGIYLNTIQCAMGMSAYTTDSEHENAIQTVIGDCRYNGDFADANVKIGNYLDNFNKYAYRSPDDKPYNYLFHTLKGYSQGEWNQVVAYSKELTQEQLESEIKLVDTWYKGEVYLVNVQKAKIYTADDGSQITDWDYDDEYACAEVVEEFFTLTAEFIYDTFGLEVSV